MNKDCQQIYKLYCENYLTFDYYQNGIYDVSDYTIYSHPIKLMATCGDQPLPWKPGDIVTWKRPLDTRRRYGIVGKTYPGRDVREALYNLDEISENQFLLTKKLKNKEDQQTGLDLLNI